MAWLFYCLVQTFIIVAFLFAAISSGVSLLGGVFIFGAAIFFFRSVNHPDFFLRRAFLVCLTLGCSHLTVGRILNFSPGHGFDPRWQIAIDLANWVMVPGPWLGLTLLGFSVVFAILELIRTSRAATAAPLVAAPYIQITNLEEDIVTNTAEAVLKVDFTVRNLTEISFILTRPRLTRFGFWPRTKRASVFEIKQATEVPIRGNRGIEVAAGEDLSLRFRANYSRPKSLGHLMSSIQRTWLHRFLFGRRRVAVSSKTDAGLPVVICDTGDVSM